MDEQEMPSQLQCVAPAAMQRDFDFLFPLSSELVAGAVFDRLGNYVG